MGEHLIKPYELSIWEDRLITSEDNTTKYFQEFKIAVLGSDTMTSPQKAMNPVLTENVNGEKTLTFSLAYKYFDPFLGERIENPLWKYLVNERKIKLFYNNKWYDFVIKTREESSEDNVFNYTARELFTIELGKVGYNITLDQSLNNNQGTITELAEKVLEDTDWQLDKKNTDLLQQSVQDPVYNGVLQTNLTVLNLDTNEEEILTEGQEIYFFYSYVANKNGSNTQFMCVSPTGKEVIDDNHVIISTNYRLSQAVSFEETEEGIDVKEDSVTLIHLSGLNYQYQGYRLAYGPLTTYDPVINRTVEVYEAKYDGSKQTIYHYLDYNYTTSDVVKSFLTNSSNFNIFEDGSVQGWKSRTILSRGEGEVPIVQPLTFVTNPPVQNTIMDLRAQNMLSTVEGFLQIQFHDVLGPNYENTYYNSGFEDSAAALDHIAAGEEFVLRSRFKIGDKELKELKPGKGGIRAVVARYTQETDEDNQYPYYLSKEAKEKKQETYLTVYKINPGNIILNFDGDFILSENIINNGKFSKDFTTYIVDDVVQTPSTLYIYQDKDNPNEKYVWNFTKNKYVLKDNNYADYYLTTAKARLSCTNKVLSDPLTKIGVFLYVDDPELVDENKYIYLQDVQLTRCYRVDGEIVLQGNVPTAASIPKDQFYLKPLKGMEADEVNLYESIDDLARIIGIDKNNIEQVYNESSEKILSIQADHSNISNILQSLCETFECWLSINVEHESNGAIKLDENHNPIKRIAFKKYSGKDNFAGFKYGINLESISRTFESEELVTKLIVDPVQSEYTGTGSVDIQHAPSNPSGQSYILNFAYYQNQGLIDTEEVNKDINDFNAKLKEINNQLNQQSVKKSELANALTRLRSKYTVIENLVSEAKDLYEDALAHFEDVTNISYEEFVSKYNTLEEYVEDQTGEDEEEESTEEPEVTEESEGSEESEEDSKSGQREKTIATNETIIEIIGQIYVAAATINNYSGILTNLQEEYNKLELQYSGAKEYGISVTVTPQFFEKGVPCITTVVVDDYMTGLAFKLFNEDEVLEYNTDINSKIFELNSGTPYQYFTIIRIPEHYKLEVFNDNTSYYVERESAHNTNFAIYDASVSKTITRRFKLVPDDDWLEKYPGYDGAEQQLINSKKQLEKEFYKKYSRYIQEGTWSSQNYVSPELYYLDALQVSSTSAQPKAEYTINIAEVSEIPERNNYYFEVGDKTYIEDIEFFGQSQEVITDPLTNKVFIVYTPIREEVIVSEVEWHLDSPDENVITIQNYKTRFEDLFQRISAAVQTVQYNEATYAKTSSILDDNGLIKSDLLSNSMLGAAGAGFTFTSDGTIRTDGSGLIFQDLTNSANCVKIINGGIQISSDGGQSWGTALDANGISTDKLTAGTINTQNIWLMDGDNPSFRWDKAGLNAYGLDADGNQAYDLKTYVRFDKYGLYGIKNGEDFVASSLQNVKDTAFFGITWDGFFIKNSYQDGGYVSISSDNDFQVVQGNQERIKIGALEFDEDGAPTKYGLNIKNADGEPVFTTGSDGNVTMTGTINATNGIFSGVVDVGDVNQNHVIIDGEQATIRSSNFTDGSNGLGWAINGEGDAFFSNVSVRGSIKTAVFEYEEIQAVGGAFLFRPSSSIKSARYEPSEVTGVDESGEEVTIETYYHYENGQVVYNDLYVIVEKPLVFRENNWVKISNYANEEAPAPTIDESFLGKAGLTHIYKIKNINVNTNPNVEPDYDIEDGDYVPVDPVTPEELPEYTNEICLEGGAAILEVTTLEDLAGGSLLDFGSHAQKEGIDVPGEHNYGIGINSSDNYVSLPPRAISLFETIIHPDATTKVTYNMRGILGTLPVLPTTDVENNIYNKCMAGTQGIYTDNMYLGDATQYLTFYTDKDGNKQLKIKASQILFEASDVPEGEDPWKDIADIEAEGVPGPAGEDAINVVIDSSSGNLFIRQNINATLICTVYKGTKDITNQVTQFTWSKKDKDGNLDESWSAPNSRSIVISNDDVLSKAIFICEVQF